jgi:alcohol dehydrogenase
MRAALFNGPGSIAVGDRPDPTIQTATDAIVRVTLACVCGSDLWYYRGQSDHAIGSIGHECIGVIEEFGADITGFAVGDLVIVPFLYSDGTCRICRAGMHSNCIHGGGFGNGVSDGGQGEYVRVPSAEATLVKVPGAESLDDDTMKSLLALSDVMSTGHHAAVSAGVKQGDIVAVVGDGAVGLCGVLAASRLGAERIIALSRHADRQQLAKEFGATDIIEARGDEADQAVLDLTDGLGVDAALECVGTGQAMNTAFKVVRAGGGVGLVGVPHDAAPPFPQTFWRNVGVRGGPAPARAYIPDLLTDVLNSRINPGRVFNWETDIDGIPEAYAAMDERRAIKSLIRVDGG